MQHRRIVERRTDEARNHARWSALYAPIGMYNDRRGFIKGRALQLLFYVIYPAHMLLLWWMRLRMGMFG